MIKIFKKTFYLLIVVTIIISLLLGCAVKDKEEMKQEAKENKTESYTITKNKTLIVNDYNDLDLDKINNYIIDVEFNPEKAMYNAKQKVIYVNNENVELNELYFHIYPNVFREKETAPFLFGNFESAYPQGFKPGYLDIRNIAIEGEASHNYKIQGKGNTILKIPLKEPLKPNEKLEIYMEYEVVMPPAQDRFGYGEKTFNFGNWYPIAAVYDDEGWNLDPYYSIGDPFYSDTSNYNVTIKAPKDITIASSGNIMSEKIEGDFKIWNIEASLMRDFAWVASKHFTKKEKLVDGTLVKVYFLDEDEEINNFAADVSYRAIEIFNDIFGQYPYSQYSVVATSFPSGMEYPGIVFIGDKYYNKGHKGYLEVVIVHETAHQWWYGVVGNDEIDEAWLDEGLTTYSEVIYTEEKYGEEVAENYYISSIENGYNYRKASIQSNEVILKPLSEFKDWAEYGTLVYDKGAMFIHEIESKFGEEILYRILKEYFDQYRFLNATTEDFIGICEKITNTELDDMVNSWLYGR